MGQVKGATDQVKGAGKGVSLFPAIVAGNIQIRGFPLHLLKILTPSPSLPNFRLDENWMARGASCPSIALGYQPL